jgi:hypothetical protein
MSNMVSQPSVILGRLSGFKTWHLIAKYDEGAGIIRAVCGRTLLSKQAGRVWIIDRELTEHAVNCNNCQRSMRAAARSEDDLPERKYCTQCATAKPREQFYLYRNKTGNLCLMPWCKECQQTYNRKYRQRRRVRRVGRTEPAVADRIRELRAQAREE